VFYLPDSSFFGSDGFTYSVCDSDGDCAQASVALTIIAGNGPPMAFIDNVVTYEDNVIEFNPLLNDTDPNNNLLPTTLELGNGPFNGTILVINELGTLRYTPNSDFFGIDSMTYTICDDGDPSLCSSSTVYFTINPINDAPRVEPDAVQIFDMSSMVLNVMINDSDVESEEMVATLVTQSPSLYGDFTLAPNGEFEYHAKPGSYCNVDVIIYKVCDVNEACSETQISINIAALDTDGDGIPDFVETTTRDTDGDGTPDYLSPDSDGDGIPDAVESGISDACIDDTPRNTDGNDTPDYRDLDSDDDGVPDANEGTGDCDEDGIPNYIDDFDNCGDRMDVPSTFSPNGDGVNDYWVIQGVQDFMNNELSVFNRWGNLVYSKKPYDNTWDGKASAKVLGSEDLPEGTYFYILILDNKQTQKGSVYIKR
jgi:gliding motility-associated-like protein